jgi:hypothetical protein
MRFEKAFLPSLGLWLALAWLTVAGCTPRLAPALPGNLVLQPGRYVTAVWRDPAFEAVRAAYALQPFTVETAQGVSPQDFQAILQEELLRAWEANGLRLSPPEEAVLTGTVQYVALSGTSLRFLVGRISARLVVSGLITRGGEPVFAFQDRFQVSSPIQPGPAAPLEQDLLLHDAARTLAVHLLNELLLYGFPAEGK